MTSIVSEVNLYDSDILTIGKVRAALDDRFANRRVDLEDYRKRIIDAFRSHGFVVDVLVQQDQDDRDYFEMTVVIKARVDAHDFDYDRQVHELVHDILDLGEGGVIKTTDVDRARMEGEVGHGKHGDC